jgi:hypothetical protein
MSRKKNEKWLDELINRTIDSHKPEFDAEKWKQKYPEEFQMLKSMSKQDSTTRRLSIWRIVIRSPITKLAAAAVIIVGIGLLAVRVHRRPGVQNSQRFVESPIQMMTAISLERAFQRGGIEAVEDQCRKAFRPLGLRPESLSFEQIFPEFNGNNKSSEGMRL